MRKKIVAGNWKMNKTLEQGLTLINEIIVLTSQTNNDEIIKIIAPSYIHLHEAVKMVKEQPFFYISAQNCNQNNNGAFTGEISAELIQSTGAKYVIIGHSERRIYFNETNSMLVQKVNCALANNLIPIFCIGENLEERNSNIHLETVKQQLKEGLFHLSNNDFSKIIIAYEPIWAIGTGITATSHQAQGMHHFIRSEVNRKYGKEISENISILYGGSCNTQNAKELFSCPDVDGGLIGGASLKANDFVSIINSF